MVCPLEHVLLQTAVATAEPVDENDLLTELKEKFDAREIEERT